MTTTLSKPSFLKDFIAIDVDQMELPAPTEQSAVDEAIAETLQSGLPSIKHAVEEGAGYAVLCVPVYRSSDIVSLAVFLGEADSANVGVMEVWQQIGEYNELNLTQGFYGTLDRFQNVSSFLRFEKGSGLPGQVWQNNTFVIHDNLPSHPGFLRAAGASAESLQVAIGIPVADQGFLASVLMISSDASPIARGYEVWRFEGDQFRLESSAYQRLEKTLIYEEDEPIVGVEDSLPGLALRSGVVSVTDDPEIIFSGRPYRSSKACSGIAIPFYENDRVTSVLTMLS